MPLRLTVIGTGYLGTAQAACLASLGFEVLGVDSDPLRVHALGGGIVPFHEPGLQPLLQAGLRSGRLSFTTDYARAAGFGDVHFICVGTPQAPGANRADLTQLENCVATLAPLLDRRCLIVGKCTVPVGTAQILSERLTLLAPGAELAWCPEFLREGHAVRDTLRPDRVVVGVESARAEAILKEIHADAIAAGVPFLVTDLATAELVKVAANAFLATKISFINAMAEVCEAAHGDVQLLAEALGYDPRIGPGGLRPGLGFGGGCLPKDIRAFMARAEELGVDQALSFLREVDAINMRRRARMVDLARELAGPDGFAGARVGVLGVAFKPDSDDIRDSPALDVAATIHGLGATVTVYDPVAMPPARRAHPELGYADSALDAARDADVVLLLTEWAEFRDADPGLLGKVVARRNIVDGRNALDPAMWRAAAWHYRALGRPLRAAARLLSRAACRRSPVARVLARSFSEAGVRSARWPAGRALVPSGRALAARRYWPTYLWRARRIRASSSIAASSSSAASSAGSVCATTCRSVSVSTASKDAFMRSVIPAPAGLNRYGWPLTLIWFT